ncbi:MAG: hypothetical protein NC223_11550 [Butyrivibrio sp.]|nr:hypothetical protein [Butyrivibrio sp.]
MITVVFRIILYSFIFAFLFVFLTRKFVNPYKLIMVFGKKGSGKSTYLAKLARTHIKKGWTVYSTEPIAGTYYITPSQIGYFSFVDYNYKAFEADRYKGFSRLVRCISNKLFPRFPKILLLVDEVGLIWDNREYKKFDPNVKKFFKFQRHHHVKCYLFSQTFDIDKKLRDLTDEMYLVRNVARIFTYGKKIRKFITIKESQTDDSSSLAEGMEFEPFILFFAGSRTLTFIPRWIKYFNSYVTPDELPELEFSQKSFDYKEYPHVQLDSSYQPEGFDPSLLDDEPADNGV